MNDRKKADLYLGFIDLRKAYDRVDREKLWECIKNLEISKRSISVLKKLYHSHRRKTKTVGGWTEWIDCQIGVKQGCILSPMLFALFIRDMLKEEGEVGGSKVGQDNIAGLMFADDVVIIATSQIELKNQIDKLQIYVINKGLEINIEKSQVLKMGGGGGGTREEMAWELKDV